MNVVSIVFSLSYIIKAKYAGGLRREHHQHGEFVLSPILSARMPQREAEKAAMGAHALGHDGVCSGGNVLLPHHRRNNL